MGREPPAPTFSQTRNDTLFRSSVRVVDDVVHFEKRCISSNHREYGHGGHEEDEFDVAVDVFLASAPLRARLGTALGDDVLQALCAAVGPASTASSVRWPMPADAEGRVWVRFMVVMALVMLLGLALGLSDRGFSLPG